MGPKHPEFIEKLFEVVRANAHSFLSEYANLTETEVAAQRYAATALQNRLPYRKDTKRKKAAEHILH